MLPIDTDETGAPAAGAGAVPERLVLFVAGGYRFGVPVARIREIIPARPYTPLPGAGDEVCGLINLRGRIVTVIDLGARLGLPPAASHPDHSIVIVEHGGTLAGLAVEEVDRIVETDTAALRDVADALRSLRVDRAYLRGVGEDRGQLFVAVDPDEVIAPVLA